MATEPENLTFSQIFEGPESKQQQTEWAVRLLQSLMDKPENPKTARQWAQALQTFRGEQLATAFTTVALTSRGWPTLGDITEAILEQEYADERQWILHKLDRHGREWKDRDPVYGEGVIIRGGPDGPRVERGPMVKPAEAAPEIPPRIKAALEILGGGSLTEGLREMNRHPATGNCQYENGQESGKAKFNLERDFKAAWYTVRRRELGGGR